MVAFSADLLDTPVAKQNAAKQMYVSRPTFNRFVDEYIVNPIRRAGGIPPKTITVRHCWALMIGRHLREQGESRETALAAVHLLRTMSDEDIRAFFEDGRTYLHIVNGEVAPRLFRRESLFCAELQQLRKQARAESWSASERIVGTEPLFRQLFEMLKEEIKNGS